MCVQNNLKNHLARGRGVLAMAKVQLSFLVINRLDLVVVPTGYNKLSTSANDERGVIYSDLEGAGDDEKDQRMLSRVAIGFLHARREDEDAGGQEGALLEDGGDLEFLLRHWLRAVLIFTDGNQTLSLALVVVIHHRGSDVDLRDKTGPLKCSLNGYRPAAVLAAAGLLSFGHLSGGLLSH